MTDREKLMKLIDELPPHEGQTFEEALADHLIANGVEIFNAEDEKVLKMARQRTMEAHGDLRYLQGVKFGVESATKHKQKPNTNGDDIRAMNDEDLATMLVFERDDWCDYQCPDGSFFDTYEEAIAYTVEWLKRPC